MDVVDILNNRPFNNLEKEILIFIIIILSLFNGISYLIDQIINDLLR